MEIIDLKTIAELNSQREEYLTRSYIEKTIEVTEIFKNDFQASFRVFENRQTSFFFRVKL